MTPVPLVRIPWLDLIRAFVAVGRRMSITLAAHDLCRTQPAVSRQIRALEDRLGTRLFVRGHRELRFTPSGQALFAVTDSLMTRLQVALATLMPPRPWVGGSQ